MIAVFGANGFIGRHLTRRLAASRDVIAVSRTFAGDEAPAPAVRRVAADFRDEQAAAAALHDATTVVQLVASSTPAMGTARTAHDISENVLPHVPFLQQCVSHGVRRYVFLSSGGTVYGPSDGTPLAETAPTNPISSHGITKLMVEKLITMHGHIDGLDYVILRVANPYGPGQVFKNGQGLIPALLQRHERGLPIQLYGDGSASRDYIFIDDLIAAIERAVDLDGHRQETLNIGTGVGTSVRDVVRTIEDVAGITFEVEHLPARKTDVPSVVLDVSRARDVLGWTPDVNFRQGVALSVAAHPGSPGLRHLTE